MRGKVCIIVLDPRGDEAGSVQVTKRNFDALVAGKHLNLPPEELETSGGLKFSAERAGFARERGGSTIHLWSEIDLFGGPKNRWTYHTNAFGSHFIRRMQDVEDAELFRLWCREAAGRPGRCASFISGCLAPEDYRKALASLRRTITQGGAEKHAGAAHDS